MINIGLVTDNENIHSWLDNITGIPEYNVSGIHTFNGKPGHDKHNHQLKYYDTLPEILGDTDAIALLGDRGHAYPIVREIVKNTKHLFLEQPISYSLNQMHELMKLAYEAGIAIHVNKEIRHNAAYKRALKHIKSVRFMELTRENPIASDQQGGTIVHSLIQDIDLILQIMGSEIKKVNAQGIYLCAGCRDIINARFEFTNGSIAQLLMNNVSQVNKHECKIYQPEKIMSVNFLNNTVTTKTYKKNGQISLNITSEDLSVTDTKKWELKSFLDEINNEHRSNLSVEDGFTSIYLVNQVMDKVDRTSF
jgi:predicted dehydrogenase